MKRRVYSQILRPFGSLIRNYWLSCRRAWITGTPKPRKLVMSSSHSLLTSGMCSLYTKLLCISWIYIRGKNSIYQPDFNHFIGTNQNFVNRLYKQYCDNYDTALAMLEKMREKNKKFKDFLKALFRWLFYIVPSFSSHLSNFVQTHSHFDPSNNLIVHVLNLFLPPLRWGSHDGGLRSKSDLESAACDTNLPK